MSIIILWPKEKATQLMMIIEWLTSVTFILYDDYWMTYICDLHSVWSSLYDVHLWPSFCMMIIVWRTSVTFILYDHHCMTYICDLHSVTFILYDHHCMTNICDLHSVWSSLYDVHLWPSFCTFTKVEDPNSSSSSPAAIVTLHENPLHENDPIESEQQHEQFNSLIFSSESRMPSLPSNLSGMVYMVYMVWYMSVK
jgi:hypothetical protein